MAGIALPERCPRIGRRAKSIAGAAALVVIFIFLYREYRVLTMRSNEADAIVALRSIMGTETAYHAFTGEYSGTYEALGRPVATPSGERCYLPDDWDEESSGYRFVLEGNSEFFKLTAMPLKPGKTGCYRFSVDDSGILRAEMLVKGFRATWCGIRIPEENYRYKSCFD